MVVKAAELTERDFKEVSQSTFNNWTRRQQLEYMIKRDLSSARFYSYSNQEVAFFEGRAKMWMRDLDKLDFEEGNC